MKIKYLSYQFIMHILSVCRKDLLIFQFFFLHFSPKIFLYQCFFHQFQLFKALLSHSFRHGCAVPPPSRREAFPRAGNFPSLSKGSLHEGAVAVRRLEESPKIFLHQCLFHQFQLFKALLYSLLLLVYALYKGGELILK